KLSGRATAALRLAVRPPRWRPNGRRGSGAAAIAGFRRRRGLGSRSCRARSSLRQERIILKQAGGCRQLRRFPFLVFTGRPFRKNLPEEPLPETSAADSSIV